MQFLSSILKIVLIDLVLSGDNAVVIGMAAHRLPLRQRKLAIFIGGGSAIFLRIALTAIAALLLSIRGLQLFGGILLIWIGFKLLKEEEESHEGVKVAASMREAIITILLADFIMSTDNVLGVAGASAGDVRLLLFGLVLSMAILMWMGSLVRQFDQQILVAFVPGLCRHRMDGSNDDLRRSHFPHRVDCPADDLRLGGSDYDCCAGLRALVP